MNTSVRVIDISSALFDDVKRLRDRYLGSNPAQEADFERREMQRDSLSYHLVYLDDDRVVGTLRVTPLGHGLSFVERAVDVRDYFLHPMDAFDANRLVLDEHYRGGQHLRGFLMQAAIWLKANTHLRFISALCRGPLEALYVGMGGSLLAQDIAWHGHTAQRVYSLVYLELDNVYRTIKEK
jgi:hypothetical protein